MVVDIQQLYRGSAVNQTFFHTQTPNKQVLHALEYDQSIHEHVSRHLATSQVCSQNTPISVAALVLITYFGFGSKLHQWCDIAYNPSH